MKWDVFLRKKELYQQAWSNLRSEFADDDLKFLEKSYLMVTHRHYQISFSASDPVTIAIENPVFIKPNRSGEALISLAERCKKIRDRNSNEYKKLLAKLQKTASGDDIEFQEFRVSLRFPTVAMDRIQRIKRSKYVDQEITDMTRVSINVTLKEV